LDAGLSFGQLAAETLLPRKFEPNDAILTELLQPILKAGTNEIKIRELHSQVSETLLFVLPMLDFQEKVQDVYSCSCMFYKKN